MLAETDLPEGAFSILPCRRDGAGRSSPHDDRLKLLSFTGSPGVGWALKAQAGKKPVVLELGGNAAVIVDEDWGDWDDAVQRILFGAFYQSGQSCIGVQRILIHESIYDSFRDKLVAATAELVKGDPKDEKTFIGRDDQREGGVAAARLDRVGGGGRGRGCCVAGTGDGVMLDATLLENVPADQDVVCQEAFGPVAVLAKFSDFDGALAAVNDSVFGLQAGVFTSGSVQGPAGLG